MLDLLYKISKQQLNLNSSQICWAYKHKKWDAAKKEVRLEFIYLTEHLIVVRVKPHDFSAL